MRESPKAQMLWHRSALLPGMTVKTSAAAGVLSDSSLREQLFGAQGLRPVRSLGA